jgi:hypothetical protein
MEEAVLERIEELMTGQSPQAQREVELTNVPVVAAQAIPLTVGVLGIGVPALKAAAMLLSLLRPQGHAQWIPLARSVMAPPKTTAS